MKNAKQFAAKKVTQKKWPCAKQTEKHTALVRISKATAMRVKRVRRFFFPQEF